MQLPIELLTSLNDALEDHENPLEIKINDDGDVAHSSGTFELMTLEHRFTCSREDAKEIQAWINANKDIQSLVRFGLACFKFTSNDQLKEAAKEWVQDKDKAKGKYGKIEDWDVDLNPLALFIHPHHHFLHGSLDNVGYLDKKRGKRVSSNLGGRKPYRFAGRNWLFKEVREWLKDNNGERTQVLLATAGFGKSAFAAQLVEEDMKDDVIAFHFCSNERASNLDPRKFIEGLVISLIKNVAGFMKIFFENQEWGDKNDTWVNPGLGSRELNDGFKRLSGKWKPDDLLYHVLSALSKVDKPKDGNVKLIVIDSLDEAALMKKEKNDDLNILDLVAKMAGKDVLWPEWTRLLVTSRVQSNVMSTLKDAKTVDLKVKLEEKEHKEKNDDDMRLYLNDRLGFDVLADEKLTMLKALDIVNKSGWASIQPLEQFVDAIVKKSEGMFLYAVFIVDGIEKGSISLNQSVDQFLQHLPGGIYEFYERRFVEMFSGDMKNYRENVCPVLEVIVAAREAIPRDVLEKASGVAALSQTLDLITAFCKDDDRDNPQQGNQDTYTLVHQSFVDWILNKHERQGSHKERRDNTEFMVNKERGEIAIKRVLLMKMGEGFKSGGKWKGWESEYFSRQGSHHLQDAVREWREDKDEAEKEYGKIADWDVSEVTSFHGLFRKAEEFNEDLTSHKPKRFKFTSNDQLKEAEKEGVQDKDKAKGKVDDIVEQMQKLGVTKSVQQRRDSRLSSAMKISHERGAEDAELEAYEIYRNMKAEQIKDFFRWNDQIVGGTKDVLVARAVDLHVNGRMMRCNECGGKWKQSEKDEDSLVCSRRFDETIGARVECFNRTDYKRVPRLPFIEERPTDEQMEAIKEENAAVFAMKDKVKVKAEQNDRTAPRPYRTHF
ncbi:hypothetical protein TrCOL_g11261 [Triparma columacea]|uniref:Nephrocystin 3-like N-terminal domain-containing protein n=1 Tax=Triparma columacea TaxID=722753 RepID=A0A9W7G718_9STRA|nr:hypothetical protein TrCOL_g11261 [Triparma columacea]